MHFSLYQKIFFWLLLNIIFLGLLTLSFIGIMLLGGSERLLPPHLFSRNIENSFRSISASLQYKPTEQWVRILNQTTKNSSLQYSLHSMDADCFLEQTPPVPSSVLQAAASIPRLPFTLCPDLSIPGLEFSYDDSGTTPPPPPVFISQSLQGATAGIPPTPPVIFMRAGDPPRYWFGRVLFVPDEQRQMHYMLLAASSDSIFGNGQFFEIHTMGIVLLLVIGFSCLWWWPFVRHISKPLLQMVAVTERVAADDRSLMLNDSKEKNSSAVNICGIPPGRKDEIGRLGEAISKMTEQVHSLLLGQRRFIRHIAHEVNSPIARIQLGLAVLEERLDGDARARVGQISADVEQLSSLTGDLLSYLRAEAAPQNPKKETVNVSALLHFIAHMEAPDKDVRINVPDARCAIWADKEYLRRAVGNVLANALKYAGEYGPVFMAVREEEASIVIEVLDQGPGIAEDELPFIMEPFFRGRAGAGRSGAGLGLSIVKHCVEACRGVISFANREEGGLCVRIRFPKAS